MIKAYKTEIRLTSDQQIKINKTLGVCRYVYIFFISHNQERYAAGDDFMSGYAFSKWLNNEYIPNNPNKLWIKEVSSKAVKKSIMNADKAFKDFFNKEKGFPKFKKKREQRTKMYAPKNSKNDWKTERHRIKIPTIGWVQLKEFGYIPSKKSDYNIKMGIILQFQTKVTNK
jgi:putative transposase